MPQKLDEKDISITRREQDAAWAAHSREHLLHEKAHDREHAMTSEALNKADAALEKRLEGMNEFRAQLAQQTTTFLTREMFDAYAKEQGTKTELALSTANDKFDTIVKAIVNRHDSDTGSIESEIQILREALQSEIRGTKDALQTEIQGEREYRKTFEGSINTWKWIATFLGASGVAGVILAFATRT